MKDRIKAVREQNNLSLTKFADRLGLTVSTVSCYESGKRVPTNSVLTAISKEFHVSLAWLKTGEGEMMDALPDDDIIAKLATTYKNLPERLKIMIDVLADMDPEWYKTLDVAFEEIERRFKKRDAE